MRNNRPCFSTWKENYPIHFRVMYHKDWTLWSIELHIVSQSLRFKLSLSDIGTFRLLLIKVWIYTHWWKIQYSIAKNPNLFIISKNAIFHRNENWKNAKNLSFAAVCSTMLIGMSKTNFSSVVDQIKYFVFSLNLQKSRSRFLLNLWRFSHELYSKSSLNFATFAWDDGRFVTCNNRIQI